MKTKQAEKELVNVLKRLKGVKAIAVHGALGQGFGDKYSDIDLTILCDKVPSIKERKEVFMNSNLTYRNSHDVKKIELYEDGLSYKKIPIGLSYKPVSYLDKKIKRIKEIGHLTKDDSIFIAWIYLTREIYDPKKIFLRYKRILNNYVKNQRKIINLYWHHLQGLFKKGLPHGSAGIETAIARKSSIWINKLFNLLIDKYLFVLYAINNTYYYEWNQKWTFNQIPKFKKKPKNCLKKLEKISILGNKSNEIKLKIKLLKELIKDTEKFVEMKLK